MALSAITFDIALLFLYKLSNMEYMAFQRVEQLRINVLFSKETCSRFCSNAYFATSECLKSLAILLQMSIICCTVFFF